MAKVNTKIRKTSAPFDKDGHPAVVEDGPVVTVPLSDATSLISSNKARLVICRVVITGNVTPYNVGEVIGKPYHEARNLIDSGAAKPHPDDVELLDHVEPEKAEDKDVVREAHGVALPSMEQVMAKGIGVDEAKVIVKRQGLLSRFVGEGMSIEEASAKIDANAEAAEEKANAAAEAKDAKRAGNEASKPSSSKSTGKANKRGRSNRR